MQRFARLRRLRFLIRNLAAPATRAFIHARAFFQRFLRPALRVGFGASGIAAAAILLIRLSFDLNDQQLALLNQITQSLALYFLAYESVCLLFANEPLRAYIAPRRLELGMAALLALNFAFQDDLLLRFTRAGISTHDSLLLVLNILNAVLLLSVGLHIIRRAAWASFLHFHPAVVFLFSFAGVVGLGWALLALPGSAATYVRPIDHLFIAISATCVTGLSPLDIAASYSRRGQWIILGLIQVGGLGLMTLTSFFGYFLSGRASLRATLVMKELLSEESFAEVRRLVVAIAALAVSIELIGAVHLFVVTPPDLHPEPAERFYYALFHSISAFCNAGFSLYSAGLIDIFEFSPAYIGGAGALIWLGGLGFPVISELVRRFSSLAPVRPRLSLTTRLVLRLHAGLVVAGALAFALLERNGLLRDLSLFDASLHALFYSISARTAGFAAVPTGAVGPPMAFFTLLLMWIGANPGSTGGGIKTSTAAVAFASVFQKLRGRERLELFGRSISESSIFRALAAVLLSFAAICAGVFVLTITESKPFFDLAFEAVSAFGTVGLSRDVTASLSDAGKLTIGALMLIGRVGVLTFFVAIIPRRPAINYRLPGDYVVTG